MKKNSNRLITDCGGGAPLSIPSSRQAGEEPLRGAGASHRPGRYKRGDHGCDGDVAEEWETA